MNGLRRAAVATVLWALWLVRRVISVDSRLYALLHAAAFQPFLARIGQMRARVVFLKAARECPAYAAFLAAERYQPARSWRLADLPAMTKDNYIKAYTIEQRCYGGRIPHAGVVIDESSGSTGQPNNWVRSAAERNDVKRILQLNYRMVYPGPGRILLNCFALGPWATGMNISMSLVDMGILKSIGPDIAKLGNTLALFGPHYHYIVFGYPPFLRMFVDECPVDLSGYTIDFVVGGEGLSEGLRSHLLTKARQVLSSYGASDLEINIAVETQTAIALRRRLLDRPELCRAVFGRAMPPMIFQYNALDYVIEANAESELLVTIVRPSGAAPKIRYNIRDAGGAYGFAALAARLAPHGIDLAALATPASHFPVLFVYGRNDASVPFYGAKVFPSDLEQILSGSPALQGAVNTFQLAVSEDARLLPRLHVHLEQVRGFDAGSVDAAAWHGEILHGLQRVNQDFREVAKLFDPADVVVERHAFGTGPFASRDIRVKNRYLA